MEAPQSIVFFARFRLSHHPGNCRVVSLSPSDMRENYIQEVQRSGFERVKIKESDEIWRVKVFLEDARGFTDRLQTLLWLVETGLK